MGVPDFLKYVARTSPGALCRLPQVSAGSATSAYDYVLVDATNADKTVGFDALFTFLCHPHVMARRALIFAVDAQRDRSGTSRHQRQSLVMVGDLDVKVQRLCVKLIDYYQKLERESGGSSFTAPMVVMSGRHVAGEADYKMLDLHRNIMAASLATNDAALPSFLFVSEDSDVVCGALCGPAPQQVTIATNLHDTMFEMGLLRLTPVLAYVAVCVDALVRTKSESTEAPHMAPQTTRPRQPPPPPPPQEAPVRIAAVEPPKEPDTGVVRRKKQDGPMVATGVRIELTDSDEDQDEEAKPTISTSAATQVSVEPSTTVTSASVSPSLGEYELAAGDLTQSSCVDLVFLFVVVMGNGANVPPLMRGVTKVDIASCWQTYCKLKYNDGTDATRQSGRRLVSLSSELSTTHRVPFRDDQASISLNCSFLQAIIDSVHYADAQTRPPVEEEQERAMTYISHALYAVVRYLVGCNMSTEAALRDSSLDMRALSEGADIAAPSLASMMWVLGQQPYIRCRFPLQGVATPEQLQHASQPGKVANEETNQATEGVAASRSQQQLQLSVGEALVAPSSSSSWAVRGAGARTIRLEQLLGKPGARPTRPAPNTRSETLSAQIKQYARAHHIGTVGQDIFSAMVGTWRRSVAMSVGELRELGSTGVFLSPATGQLVTGPLPTEGEQQNSNSSGRLVYSFELRRMTPVAEMAKPTQSNNSSSSSAEKSHLMAALGLSFDYDAVERPTPVSGEVRERDLMKEARRAAASAKRSRPEEGSDKKGEKMSRSETAGEQDKTKDGATAKKRPGKKERQRLQQQQQQQQASQPNSA